VDSSRPAARARGCTQVCVCFDSHALLPAAGQRRFLDVEAEESGGSVEMGGDGEGDWGSQNEYESAGVDDSRNRPNWEISCGDGSTDR
jgi:hypothetical protein